MRHAIKVQPVRPTCLICGEPASEQPYKSKLGFTLYRKVCTVHQGHKPSTVSKRDFNELVTLIKVALNKGTSPAFLKSSVEKAIRNYHE